MKLYFIDNNINNSNDLGNKGLNYWNNELKIKINPSLFKKPSNKEELENLIKTAYPLILINTFNITDFSDLFKFYYYLFVDNDYDNSDLSSFEKVLSEEEKENSLKSKEYWENPLNYLGFWNTNKVTNLSSCFYGQLLFNQKLFWNTNNVKNSKLLFSGCEKLNQEIELNLPNCKKISCMFSNCKKLNSRITLNNLNNIENI